MLIPKNMITLLISVIIHYAVFLSFVLTCILGFASLPWYVAITLLALIGRVIFSSQECPLTTFENKCRKKLNVPISHGFMKSWILRIPRTIKEFKNAI